MAGQARHAWTTSGVVVLDRRIDRVGDGWPGRNDLVETAVVDGTARHQWRSCVTQSLTAPILEHCVSKNTTKRPLRSLGCSGESGNGIRANAADQLLETRIRV